MGGCKGLRREKRVEEETGGCCKVGGGKDVPAPPRPYEAMRSGASGIVDGCQKALALPDHRMSRVKLVLVIAIEEVSRTKSKEKCASRKGAERLKYQA
jgi:hypothetical protein